VDGSFRVILWTPDEGHERHDDREAITVVEVLDENRGD
jgi:hypothetical protein